MLIGSQRVADRADDHSFGEVRTVQDQCSGSVVIGTPISSTYTIDGL